MIYRETALGMGWANKKSLPIANTLTPNPATLVLVTACPDASSHDRLQAWHLRQLLGLVGEQYGEARPRVRARAGSWAWSASSTGRRGFCLACTSYP
jgi:hypothetical protein